MRKASLQVQPRYRTLHLVASITLIVFMTLSTFMSDNPVLAAGSISGTVFEDATGIAATSGTGISGLTVRLYSSTGTFVTSISTGVSGDYAFASQPDGTYYVTVQAPTTGGVAEQTYGAVLNGGSGSGPICVGLAPTYSQQSSSTPSAWSVSGNGPCYGGRQGAVADINGSTLTQNEHVARVVIAGSAVSGVDFGFSYNTVSNINNAGQGSLRQFITNANGIAGANAMRFVPTVSTNSGSGSNTWWRATLATNLPAVIGAQTTVDGTAYSNIDGTTVLDTNPGNLKPATVVGYLSDQATIAGLAKPELQIDRGTTGLVEVQRPVFDIQSANFTLRKTSVTLGTESIAIYSSNASTTLIEDNALGVTPDGTDSVPANTTSSTRGSAIKVGYSAAGICSTPANTGGVIQHNLMRGQSSDIIFMPDHCY